MAAHSPAESPEALFNQLFEMHYDALRNYLYYKSGNMEQAEDLTQEAFSILWQKKNHLQAERAKSYLYTIATNLFLNEVKHQQVVLKFRQKKTENTVTDSPEFLMEMSEFQTQLEAAISRLPEKARVVFLMNRIDKLTYREIAERLGIGVKAVEKRMQKALAELRQLTPRI